MKFPTLYRQHSDVMHISSVVQTVCVGVVLSLLLAVGLTAQTASQRQKVMLDMNALLTAGVSGSLQLDWQLHGTGTLRSVRGDCEKAYDSTLIFEPVLDNGVKIGYMVGRITLRSG